MPYYLQVIFDAVRLIVCFVILFGWLGPRVLPFVKSLRGIDRLIYSCVGLGGLIIVVTFLLTMFKVYDFISLFVCLLVIPFSLEIIREIKRGTEFNSVMRVLESRFLKSHIRFIEYVKGLSIHEIKSKLFKTPEVSFSSYKYVFFALLIGAGAGVVRLIPVLNNSAPLSRTWYFELEAVKQLRLQQYFTDVPTPKGMHSIVQMFSTLTQVTPEMILHILGALISFYLAILIFWVIREITKGEHKMAALFGMGVYAFLPTVLLPVSLDLEAESSSLQLALCFAIPTAFIFLRNIRSKSKAPWFYVTIGVFATALINIFVLIFILLPFLIFGLLTIPRKFFFRNFIRLSLYILTVYSIALAPFVLYLLYTGGDISFFFELQFYNTLAFSYFPNLITDLDVLATLYLGIGLFLLVGFLIRHFYTRQQSLGDEIIFLIMFCLITYLYTPYFNLDFILIDPDQLNSFYSFIISVTFGILFYAAFTFLREVFKLPEGILSRVQPVMVVLLIGGAIVWQRGIHVSNDLPQTLPNGFFKAYYKIVYERLPYSYSTVGPEIDRTLALNRHYFMNYQFFLDNYGAIDSLYQQYLTVPVEARAKEAVPPASIFVFVEKPPYESFQQGIVYESSVVMQDIEQWLASFQSMEGRELRVFYESNDTIVYEIVNREGESDITSILFNIYPKEESRASRLFK